MLDTLLKHLNLMDKKYFTRYEIDNELLIIKAEGSVDESDLYQEVEELRETIGDSLFDFSYENAQITISYKAIFEEITRDVKELIKERKVLFPTDYNELFVKIAFQKNSKFDFLDMLNCELVEDRVAQHVLKLDECAHNALDAMRREDKIKLESVIDETSELKKEIKALKKSVYEDFLTKAHNRKWFDEKYIDKETNSFTKNGILILVDLNDFKYINDHYGHVAGDKVLVYVAKRLKKISNHIIRYGGDEFLIVLDDSNALQTVQQKMYQLREMIAKKVLKANEYSFHISFSFGVVEFSKSQDFNTVLSAIDERMYSDKTAYKNRKQ